MYHFFAEPSQVTDHEIVILGSDVNHMHNVLRLKEGEQIVVSDGQLKEYRCEIVRYDREKVYLDIVDQWVANRELSSEICLFQGLPKGEKMDFIVQKAVELGVSTIQPVITRRTIVKLDNVKAQKKTRRWQEIAKGAAKQSGRSKIPEVLLPITFKEAIEKSKIFNQQFIPYELATNMAESKRRIDELEKGTSVAIFIGPEGGFEAEEVEQALQGGAFPMSLGRRILRTETAAMTILSLLMFQLEEESDITDKQ